MGYSDTISALRESLDGYSAEEERIASLYAKALQDAKVNFRNAEDQLHYTYGMERHAAFSDNARNDRSFNQLLAARGLGFSGEAAQAKLNSNILLTNQLRQIGLDNAKTTKELVENYNNNVTKLKAEEAEKMKEIADSRNQLTADIAAMELEKENTQAKLEAEQAIHSAELEAEKEMFYAELAKKYENAITNIGNVSGNGSSDSTGNTAGKTDNSKSEPHSYVPDISAESLAKQLVSTATPGDTKITSSYAQYSINRYLVNLYEKYDVDYDYFNQLIFMLGTHGFFAKSYPEIRVDVITYECNLTYKNAYDDCYERFVLSGTDEASAKNIAKKEAQNKSMIYIYDKARNLSEFKQCCYKMGFTTEAIDEFLRRFHDESPIVTSGSSGGDYRTRDE